MGSKNLRAVAVRGTKRPEFHDPDLIKTLAKHFAEKVKTDEFFSDFRLKGTTLNIEWEREQGGVPTNNWRNGNFEHEDNLSGNSYYEQMVDEPGTCWACAQSCKRDIKAGITEPYAIEEKYGEQVKVIFYDVWKADQKKYAEEYGVRLIPTQVFLDKNGKEIFRHEGFFPESDIDKLLQKHGLQPKQES